MKLPQLNELSSSRTMIDVFRGYNHNLRISEGEFYNMTNLTSNDYPVLSPRPKRGVYKIKDKSGNDLRIAAQGLIAKDVLCCVDCVVKGGANGARFFIGGEEVQGLELSTLPQDLPKKLVSMGSYVIIMPDKMYVNTQKDKVGNYTYGSIEASFESKSGDEIKLYLANRDGTDYEGIPTMSLTAPNNPTNKDLWIDTSGETNVLKQYYETNKQWITIGTPYLRIECPGIGLNFNDGDGVEISGVVAENVSGVNGNNVIWAKDKSLGEDGKEKGNWILVSGIGMHVNFQDDPNLPSITIKRKMPIMDFIIESGNRLWGCRYGEALNGEFVNEIYVSKLGDFKNWNCFAGISTDSYVASVGTDGQFTGAISHLGYPIFFKDNCMHKVYGNYPANYQIQTTACRGVQKGSENSLAIVNEVLYYKSQSAICAYDGSLPTEISSALGDETFSSAVGGSLGNKYYVSMKDSDDKHHLFVYDTKKGMWHREDNTYAKEFCTSKGELYFIDGADGKIKTILGSGEKDNAPVKWSAETGIIGTDSPDKKYISKIDVRLSIKIGARVYFYIQYDSSGEWEHICTMTGRTLKSVPVSIRPQRCDHLRLRIDGDGETKIFSICKTIEQGSDM